MLDKLKQIQLRFPVWIYMITLFFFVYLFVQILNYRSENSSNLIIQGMYMLNFGVHEMSHILFMFLPEIFVALAGSVGEISFTILILLATIKSKAYFACVFAGLWIMLAFNSVGRYIADARSQLLPLVGPGEVVNHDWYFILNRLNLLQFDTFIGAIFRFIGAIIGLIAIAFGVWLIYRKATYQSSTENFKLS